MRIAALTLALVVGLAGVVQADIFDVVVTGEVEFNQIGASPLGDANSGDSVEMFFQVDSDNFLDSLNFPTRGYEIILDSFVLQIGSVIIGLQDPFPAETPYFVIRNDDPAVDGFFLANSPDAFPNGVPLDQTGSFTQFMMNYSTTYGNDPLSSLNIADAVGFYDFTGLTVFGMTIDDGPFNAMGMIFTDMTISPASAVVPEPNSAAVILVAVGLMTMRRRR